MNLYYPMTEFVEEKSPEPNSNTEMAGFDPMMYFQV